MKGRTEPPNTVTTWDPHLQQAVAGAALMARNVDSACAIAVTRMGAAACGFMSSMVEAPVEDSCNFVTNVSVLQGGLKYCTFHDGGNTLTHSQSGDCSVGPAIGSCNIDLSITFDVSYAYMHDHADFCIPDLSSWWLDLKSFAKLTHAELST